MQLPWPRADRLSEYFIIGRVRRAHGIRGELVVETLTDAPDAIFAPGRRVFVGTTKGDLAAPRQELRVLRATPFKDGLIVAFAGITDRTAAEAWRGRHFLVPESEVPPPSSDEIFVHELVGMRVAHVNGQDIGVVTQVLELPQGFVLEVQSHARSVLLPFNEQTVTMVDSASRVIQVDPVEGLLD